MKFTCEKYQEMYVGLKIRFRSGVYETENEAEIRSLIGLDRKYGVVADGPVTVTETLDLTVPGTAVFDVEEDENAEGGRIPDVTAEIIVPDATEAADEPVAEEAAEEAAEDTSDGEGDEGSVEEFLLTQSKDEIEAFARPFGIELDKRRSIPNMVADFVAARAKQGGE